MVVVRWVASLRDSPQTGQRPGALGPAEEADRSGKNGRIVPPAADIQLVVDHVGAAQLVVIGFVLVDLAGVDLELLAGGVEAAHARPLEPQREAEPKRVAAAWPREVEAGIDRALARQVGLPGQLHRVELDRDVQPPALAMGEREACQVNDRGWRLGH